MEGIRATEGVALLRWGDQCGGGKELGWARPQGKQVSWRAQGRYRQTEIKVIPQRDSSLIL